MLNLPALHSIIVLPSRKSTRLFSESGQASDETIMDMAGHVSKQMLKHYSHIRMEAKRRAVESLN